MADTPTSERTDLLRDDERNLHRLAPNQRLPFLLDRLSEAREQLASTQQDTQRLKAQMEASTATERKDCEKALLVLSGARYPTPAEGYGTNSSWAISDLCRCVAAMAEAKEGR